MVAEVLPCGARLAGRGPSEMTVSDTPTTPTESVLPTPLREVISIDEGKVQSHLDRVVRETVEQTLNALLDAEADELCGAKRYARSPDRVDTRAGSYDRTLHTTAGEVTLKVVTVHGVG